MKTPRKEGREILLSKVEHNDNFYNLIDLRLFQIEQGEDKHIFYPTISHAL